jgi:hypothetical protein
MVKRGLFTIVALVSVYVISVGPASYLDQRGYLPDGLFHSIYRPVFQLAATSTPTLRLLLDYLRLCHGVPLVI